MYKDLSKDKEQRLVSTYGIKQRKSSNGGVHRRNSNSDNKSVSAFYLLLIVIPICLLAFMLFLEEQKSTLRMSQQNQVTKQEVSNVVQQTYRSQTKYITSIQQQQSSVAYKSFNLLKKVQGQLMQEHRVTNIQDDDTLIKQVYRQFTQSFSKINFNSTTRLQDLNSTMYQEMVDQLPDHVKSKIVQTPNKDKNETFGLVKPKISIVTLTADDIRNILRWIRYHQLMGIQYFYLFVDGQAKLPENINVLRMIEGVTVFVPSPSLDQYISDSGLRSTMFWLKPFVDKPCNYDLFVKQSYYQEVGVSQALADGMDWIGHVDTDEVIYIKDSQHLNVQEHFMNIPAEKFSAILYNDEGVPESGMVDDSFSQVSLFRQNYKFIPNANYHAKLKALRNKYYFLTYVNGKSFARVTNTMHSFGAHRWFDSYKGEEELQEVKLLHYTYTKFSDVKTRRDRCDCAPIQSQLKGKCFFLEFDTMVYVKSSLSGEEEIRTFFEDQMVWSDKSLVDNLIQNNIYQRIEFPQAVMMLSEDQPLWGLTLKQDRSQQINVINHFYQKQNKTT